jgi:hypothetical protein
VTTSLPYQAYPGSAPEYRDGPPPVLVAVADPAPQRRLTVLVRLLLLVPHFFVLYFLALAACVVAFLGWWGALFTGRLPLWAGSFLAGLLRWGARVIAYELLLTDDYPPFTFDDAATYPVRLALPEPQRLNRAAVFFRIILVIPASIVGSVIGFGSGTLMGFIAWLITLVAGRLPASYHQAFTAVVRYQVRYYAYWLMLTPTYPGGLFGDKPGMPTWADQPAMPAENTPPFGAAPGYGTPESVYGTAPGGYGTPYSPYAAPGGAPVPGGYGYPAGPGYGAPAGPGYGAPAGPGYGYGAPTGYGAPAGYGARPLFQPASWSLLLTSGAKRLVTTFIVLGAVLWIADIGLQVAHVRSEVNAVIASNATAALSTSYGTLNSQLTTWNNAVQACNKNLPCVTSQDATAATDFSAFASRLQAILLPASAASAGARLEADATTMARDFTVLSQSTTVSQYQSTFASTGLAGFSTEFNTDYLALGKDLASS